VTITYQLLTILNVSAEIAQFIFMVALRLLRFPGELEIKIRILGIVRLGNYRWILDKKNERFPGKSFIKFE
jgi:hypothetical protein